MSIQNDALQTALSNSKNADSFFIGLHNEPPPVAAVRICNPDCSPVGINR
jgi:hypothetical protein